MTSDDRDMSTDPALEQQKRLVTELSPALDRFATEWHAEVSPLVSQLRESFAIGNPALEHLVQQVRDAFLHIKIPAIELSAVALPKIDLTVLLRGFPSNLHARVDELERLGEIALDDGIPVAWVPRDDILTKLLIASSTADRYALLVQHCDEILDDCDTALADRSGNWAGAARESIDSARHGTFGVAQSHAANLIDSVLLAEFADPTHSRNTQLPRTEAESLARKTVSLEDTLNQLGRHLAVRPMPSAFARWHPGDPPPTAFNRHATAHCVGHPNVFTEAFCLVAIMWATSLVCQFGS